LVAHATGFDALANFFHSGEVGAARYSYDASATTNLQGLWWRAPAESQSGWGVNVVHQGDLVFATWFTYDAQRRPLWMVMSEGFRVGPNEYAGVMYEVTGPPFDSAAWDTARVQTRPVGTGVFSFVDAGNGTFRFIETAGRTVTHPITRQLFASPVPTCGFGGSPSATNFTDLWWRAPAGSERGWGLNVVHQGEVIFATWFTYGADGSPLWLVASEMKPDAGGAFTGELFRASGPGFAVVPWDPATVTRTRVGSATLAFSGANAGTFTYTMDAIAGSKPITRQLFASPQTVCR
ncbi:MAG TPA: hypothetical protein VFV33_17800, partial [Gemmatimonadaceae bacterium]|nr:hypothetical protein [Gemmatimonadaceae bacterium]